MAEETPLEKTAKTAPQQKAEEKKPIGTLENVVNESIHGAKSLFNLGLAIAPPLALMNYFPYMRRETAVITGAQVLGDATTNFKKGQKTTAGDIAKSSVFGTLMTPWLYGLFSLLNKIPTDDILGYVGKGLAFGGLGYPAYVATYQFGDYVTKNLTFKGSVKYVKENFWPVLTYAWTRVFPFGLANVLFTPSIPLQIAVSSLLSYVFVLFGAPKKGEVPEHLKREKTPYLTASSNVLGKLGSAVIYSPFKALYEIGSGLYKAVPKPAAPAPAAVPATAPAH